MLTSRGLTNSQARLNLDCQTFLHEALGGLEQLSHPLKLSAGTLLTPGTDPEQKCFYTLLSGGLRLEHTNGTLLIFEQNDGVGADQLAAPFSGTLRADFGVELLAYPLDDLFGAFAGSPTRLKNWSLYLSCYAQLIEHLLADELKQDSSFSPAIRSFEPGEYIIQEGSTSDDVYTMLSGSAEVMIGETSVGKIYCDEIFGAIAAFTGEPRTASVKTLEHSMIMLTPSDNFRSLLGTHPETIEKLIQDMARTIVSNNQLILELRKTYSSE